MSNGKYQNKYRIPSARAWWHDYNGGAYFITVRTKNGIHYFGKIDELSLIGQYLYKTIQEVSKHHTYAEIPLFVVMPNHWHAIVLIDGDVETLHATSLHFFAHLQTFFTFASVFRLRAATQIDIIQ